MNKKMQQHSGKEDAVCDVLVVGSGAADLRSHPLRLSQDRP